MFREYERRSGKERDIEDERRKACERKKVKYT
jgi:hypothetical protein